jgi:hypothetical protein
MIRRLLVLLLLLLTNCVPGAITVQAQIANGISATANAALPVLVSRFKQEGLDAIHHVKDTGGSAADAQAALVALENAWAPVWLAWEALRVSHDLWATALEKKTDPAVALEALRHDFCALLGLWPKGVPALLSPVRCGGGAS